MCFTAVMLFYEEENRFLPHSDQLSLQKDMITTEDLIPINYIGNFSCCMYRTEVVRRLPKEIFQVYTVDWMFNMACGEWGKIGFIREYMSVYRKHASGAWSGQSMAMQLKNLINLIDVYDDLLHNKYHDQFQNLKLDIEALAKPGSN